MRITNKLSEVVIKKGSLHADNRIEISQPISKNQFLGMVKVFSQLEFDMEIGERENYNFSFPGNVAISLVRARDISYIEIEKISSESDQAKNKKILEDIAGNLNIKIINTKKDFDILCQKLSKTVDWKFTNTKKDYQKLQNILKKYY